MAVCATCGHPLMEHMGEACYCGCREAARGVATGLAGVGAPRIVAQPNGRPASLTAGRENVRELDQDLHRQAVAAGQRTKRVPDLVAHAWRLHQASTSTSGFGPSFGLPPTCGRSVVPARRSRSWMPHGGSMRTITRDSRCSRAQSRHTGYRESRAAQKLVDYQRARATDEKFERAAQAVAADLAALEAPTAA